MEQPLELIATYAALGLSVTLAIERMMSAARNRTEKTMGSIERQVQKITEFKSHIEGAAITERLTKVEAAQRADENSLVRVEGRLSTINTLLGTLVEEIRE